MYKEDLKLYLQRLERKIDTSIVKRCNTFPDSNVGKVIIYDNKIYFWNGTEYEQLIGTSGNYVTEEELQNAINGITVGTNINVVDTYSSLPAANVNPGVFYWVENDQGVKWTPDWDWIPFGLGDKFYSKGLYYSNGVKWEIAPTPYQATQAEVDAGTEQYKFVTSKTLRESSQWNTKVDVVDGKQLSTEDYTTEEKNKLFSIEANAEVNNISDANAAELTNGDTTELHNHNNIYYTELEIDAILLNKSDTSHTHTKGEVGLGNVDNTSDLNKPISTATQTALNTKLENVTGTLPISTSGTGVTRNISIATANGSTTGALTGTDWTTFNNKVGGTGAVGQAGFFTGTNTLSGDNNFFWDNTSKRLGLGTSTPERVLNVVDPSNPQLRLTRAQGVSHTDLQSLVNGDFSILPSFRRVGLFTNNPQDLPGWGGGKGLHIYDSGNIPFLYLSSPNNWGGFGLDNTRCYFYTRKGLRFYYNSVAGELNSLAFHNQTSGADVKVFEVNQLNQAVFGTSAAALSTRLTVQGQGATGGTFSLQVHNSTNASNSLIVRDDGNIGIGTNAPTEKLHVTGNIRATTIPTYATTAAAAADGGLTAGSFFKVSNGNGTSALHIKD